MGRVDLLLFRIIADIFRNHEMGGFAKALWLIFVVIAPFLGVLIYVIVYSGDTWPSVTHLKSTPKQQEQSDASSAAAAGSGSSADELVKLAALKDQGVITDAEFAAQKAKLLS